MPKYMSLKKEELMIRFCVSEILQKERNLEKNDYYQKPFKFLTQIQY